MDDATLEFQSGSFLQVAVQHKLLKPRHAEQIAKHCATTETQASDAALTLSLMEPFEVEAVNLLCRPESLFPGYVLTGLIGCGANGLVFEAFQKNLGRSVALKTIWLRSQDASSTGRSRIQREAHAIAKLHHPGIVTAYDSGIHDGRFCIAMEMVSGGTLTDFIKRESPIEERVAWGIIRQVAAALSHANESGIVHRDIKPSNLLLSEAPAGLTLPDGVPLVKVVDFGLAFESEQSDDAQLTATGMTLGTPAYVAPEQLDNSHVDLRADIYALGATAFHILTGNAPNYDLSPMKVIMHKTLGDERWREQTPESLSQASRELLFDMTHAKVDDRIQDYDSLLARIDTVLSESNLSDGDSASTQTAPDRSSSAATKSDAASNDAAPKLPGLPRGGLSRRQIVGGALGLAAGTIAGGLLLTYSDWFSGTRNASNPEAEQAEAELIEWAVDGFPVPLFNGQSVPRFRQAGFWSPEVAQDGSRVLTGARGARMTIPLELPDVKTRNMRFRVGVYLSEDATLQVDIKPSNQQNPSASVKLGATSISLSSVTDGKATELNSLPIAGPSRQHTGASEPTLGDKDKAASVDVDSKGDDSENAGDEVVFQRLQFQRQDSAVVVIINGQELGRIPAEQGTTTSLELTCQDGPVNLADLDIVPLKPSPGN
ncbi:MAG: hypothetical protein Aurels2KO_40200 [Aureliella sp.]